MTVEEIYSKIANHMIKGMMFHEQLTNYYDFLGLKGYKRCQEYHYLDETINYRKLCRYYINHHDKLIETGKVEDPNVIPQSWYKYTRQDVDNNTRANAVKNGFSIWVDWESETKDFYEEMFSELTKLGEIASALELDCFIKDVDIELKKAERKYLELKAVDFDMSVIIPEQEAIHDKYKQKIKEILC